MSNCSMSYTFIDFLLIYFTPQLQSQRLVWSSQCRPLKILALYGCRRLGRRDCNFSFYILYFLFPVCMFYIFFSYSAETLTGITTTRPLTLLGSNLLLHSVPSAPSNLQALITSTRFITLAWDQPESNNLHITGYSVFYQQEGSERWDYDSELCPTIIKK